MKSVLYYLAVAVALLGCLKKAEVTKSKKTAYVKVAKGELVGKLRWKGVVRSANRIEVRASRKVQIKRVHVRNFSSVKKGQLLISVDRSEAQKKKAEILDRQKKMKLEMEAARVKYEHNKKILGRKKHLLDKEIIAQKEYDRAFKEYKLTETDQKSKKLEMEKMEREVAEILAQAESSDFYAPMDGTVSDLISTGRSDEARAGQLLAVVSDPTDLALWVPVEENNLRYVGRGRNAEVTLDSLPGRKMRGKILEVSVSATEGSAARGIKTYDTSIQFKLDQKTKIREGYTGKAEVLYARKLEALTIPLNAVKYLDGKDFVVAATSDGGTGTPRSVKLGLKTDAEAEVLQGLSENEFVIVDAE